MHTLDWIVLIATLLAVFLYGFYALRNERNSTASDFLVGKKNLHWWTIGLSIMATQASAVTFLSTPGQAYTDGMEFGQFYFGMPIAMILLSIFVLPFYYTLKVTTAYEYLEERFGVAIRVITAVIFLIQRSISAAITLLAPAIVLSVALNWDLTTTTILSSLIVIGYTALGGNEIVSRTQELQMTIMLLGLVAAFLGVVYWLPPDIHIKEAWQIATLSNKTKLVDTSFSWSDRYNIWTGLIAGVFLFLSYFGTDQSQVGRYLSGKSLKESRMGLLFNGFLKVPMQLLVLSVGVMVFVFYQVNTPPLHFNPQNTEKVMQSKYASAFASTQVRHDSLVLAKSVYLSQFRGHYQDADATVIGQLDTQIAAERNTAKEIILKADPTAKTKDADYVFIQFVLSKFPQGFIGFMLAMIFCAAWSTTASELNALTATSVTDIYKRLLNRRASDQHYIRVAQGFTLLWGALLTMFALKAGMFENLIQAVNMAGSVFYGTILGIFMTAFYLKQVKQWAVGIAALIVQGLVVWLFFTVSKDAYLWYIPLATGLIMGLSLLIQFLLDRILGGKTQES